MTVAIIIIMAFTAILVLVRQDRNKAKKQTIEVDEERCAGCGGCIKRCRRDVLSLTDKGGKLCAEVTCPEHCTACGHCMVACRMRALRLTAGYE